MAVKRYDGSAWQTVAGLGAQGPTGADGSAPLTTKGDLLTRSSTTATRLGVGTNGQILVADSAETTGLKWINNGFVLLNSTSFTAATATSVNNVFSSTYKHYLILIEGATTTNNATSPRIKLRVSGTDSSASYNNQYVNSENTTTASGRETNTTSGFYAGETNYVDTIRKSYHSFRLVDPGTAVRTSCIGDGGNNLTRANSLGMHDVATAYDGFTIVTGYNFTGTVRTYGLAE